MPRTLLLADDSVTIQKVVGISFANEDVKIVTVDNGDDAVTRAREIRPDIVLADVVMPGKNGYDVCAALKGDPELAHIPVLLLTGTFETFDEARAAEVGADGHVTKPFEAQALVDLVTARLAEASPAAARRESAPAPAPAQSPEPFDFLEPEAAAEPQRTPASASDDAFGFEDEPLETIDLEADAEELDLGNEATAARTTLLLDDEAEFENAATAPPLTPPAASPPPDEVPAEVAAELDEASDLTHLVLPVAGEPAVPDVEPADGDPLSGLEPLAAESFDEGAAQPEWDVASSDLLEPTREDAGASVEAAGDVFSPAPEPPSLERGPIFADDPAAEFELATPEPVPELEAPPTEAAPELSDEMREQVHATIEKIAWEALGDVSDRIVREAVTRIEQVAWDVIPRLAETLIREEIRKLKGED